MNKFKNLFTNENKTKQQIARSKVTARRSLELTCCLFPENQFW